jgi:Ca2+-binding RTX toxin-like protein
MSTRRTLGAAAVAIAALSLGAEQASATARIESTGTNGLVIRDKEGTSTNDIEVRLRSGGDEWDVRPFNESQELGPGCRERTIFGGAICGRFAAKVTATLAGGDDRFAFRVVSNTFGEADSLPTSDPFTINLGAGNDSGTGAAGNDVLNGGPGNDTLVLGTGADSADGADGDDVIFLATQNRDETDQVNGGLGADLAAYSEGFNPPSITDRVGPLRIVEANLETLAGEKDTNEDDVLRSIESYSGGAGPDIITGVLSSNNSTYRGGLSNDQLFGTSGENRLIGGAGRDELSGKGGNDSLNGKIGESTAEPDSPIDCGAGTGDAATVDLQDAATVGCDGNVSRSAIGEGPHVRLKFRRVVEVVGGRISARLRCPRALRHRCSGTLRVRLRQGLSPRTRYAIRAGRSRRVTVRLGALRRRVGRRTVGALVSVERGDVKGVKTTSRRLVLRR